ncbi:MAG: DUF4115 domain-containing protein [Desulfuromonadaceae bacterium]|nr:DUF4115 domain-containing protein [Desulfuromonadaceae bacterium]MDD2854421.1 DUF4115 domain-containing protein [Desulfuromonadaceae bacterium]
MSVNMVSDDAPVLPDSSATSPGAILRRCREFHEITLEEASETTKIGVTHLKALEEDRINDFANKAYLKGFLRIYATYLGLNSEDVARMYEKLFGITEDTSAQPYSSISHQRMQPLFSLKKLVIPAFLLAVIIIIAIFFKQPPPPPVRPPETPTITTAQPALPAATIQTVQSSAQLKKRVQPIAPEPDRETVAEESPVAVKTPPPQTENRKEFILKIKATHNGTLKVSVDGSASEEHELMAGDVIEWRAEKKISLELSDTGAVDVELNGKSCPPLGSTGKSLYVEYNADGVVTQ